MSAQKGPFGLKQTQTGRKAPERPTTPQECPKHHKTLWLVGYHWYDILSRTLRPFGYPSGAHWDRICPKTSLLVLIDDPMVATKDRKESKNFAKYLSGLARFHTILAFPGISKRVFLVSEGPKRTFGEAQRFTYHKLIILIFPWSLFVPQR